ncbi:oxaloacetate decarboxylase subunit gamma [Pseudoalteromonas denitrificans]|uniref:Probable oxaloacetate decarboxylase gamma chain n=1 Tax=Pseudoalteromonas denitrificans DSM 6059 TaxID=1123010 RepID=A0A1I1PMJ9_9GAMM|nr:oxaloacetate decarboxylase subunit gamma [Pseudoalteromonas denitrificans]SFD10975.1 oxaloacetate decarboxylase, gamma subunit [Pseudoalteromonas denitrificans DSM 6059]
MDITSLLLQAANLMLTGMVVVFIFLLLLISVVKLMSSFLASSTGESVTNNKAKNTVTIKSSAVPDAHIAAIAGAIHQHRQKYDHKKT